MKTLKVLIRIEAVLLAVLGWLEAFANRNLGEAGASRAPQDDLALSFLGMGFLVFAVLLFVVSDLMLAGNRRKLARWLAGGNAFLSLSAFAHGSGEPLDWALLLIPAVMAVALAWASAIPLKPEDAAAELAEARIPDEVRQALLRQVGEAAAQEERNRLARDLHDSIKQQLFTINVGAATAQERWERDPEGAQAALVDVRRSAREAMVEMQAMLHQLRPQALTSTTGLVEALREQAEALGYRSGAHVTVELGPEIPDDRMPPGAQEALFRIAQEALANVARHARAGTVRVWIGQKGEEAVLRVEDDGQGFDPEMGRSGMGLRNMRERAGSLRGTLGVRSGAGEGTALETKIPLLSVQKEALLARLLRDYSRLLWITCLIAVASLLALFDPALASYASPSSTLLEELEVMSRVGIEFLRTMIDLTILWAFPFLVVTSLLLVHRDTKTSSPQAESSYSGPLWQGFSYAMPVPLLLQAFGLPSSRNPYTDLVVVSFLIASTVVIWWGARTIRRRHPEMNLTQRACLQFAVHHARAALFFAAALRAPWSWRFPETDLSSGERAWLVVGFASLVLGGLELVQFHRWSELRRTQPAWLSRLKYDLARDPSFVGAFVAALVGLSLLALLGLSFLGFHLIRFLSESDPVRTVFSLCVPMVFVALLSLCQSRERGATQ